MALLDGVRVIISTGDLEIESDARSDARKAITPEAPSIPSSEYIIIAEAARD